jgi:chorismate mutase-like protein
MADDTSLDNLRRDIDSIDERIHDLLMQRTEIVSKVGTAKRKAGAPQGALALRPGREAEILRRLVERHTGPFPVGALVRIWRELLSAQVAVQGDYTIAVFAPDEIGGYQDMGRNHFGSWVPVKKYQSLNQIVQDVWNGNVSIGILPFPVGERESPWWRSMIGHGEGAPKVIGRLPFLEMLDDAAGQQAAVAIAVIDPEPTGDDVSMLAVQRVEDVSRDRLREELESAGLDGELIAACQDPDEEGRTLHLVLVDGFLRDDDSRLEIFGNRTDSAVRETTIIGIYPRPISVADID